MSHAVRRKSSRAPSSRPVQVSPRIDSLAQPLPWPCAKRISWSACLVSCASRDDCSRLSWRVATSPRTGVLWCASRHAYHRSDARRSSSRSSAQSYSSLRSDPDGSGCTDGRRRLATLTEHARNRGRSSCVRGRLRPGQPVLAPVNSSALAELKTPIATFQLSRRCAGVVAMPGCDGPDTSRRYTTNASPCPRHSSLRSVGVPLRSLPLPDATNHGGNLPTHALPASTALMISCKATASTSQVERRLPLRTTLGGRQDAPG